MNPRITIAFFLMTYVLMAQELVQDTDRDGLSDPEESRYGLSLYLADTNQNGIADLQQADSWEVEFAPGLTSWSADWTPPFTGTYRFILSPAQHLQLSVGDSAIPPYTDNQFEVIGLPSQKTVVSLEIPDGAPPPASPLTLTAFFIDGLDADGDGIGLDWELALRSDPANPDSDGDGLTDGEEVLRYGTDLLNNDSNQDGIPDFVEITTQPARFTTDREGYWEEKNENVTTRNPTKALLYRLSLPYAGTYRLGVVTHPESTASGTLKFYLDGALQGETSIERNPLQLYRWVEFRSDKPVIDNAGRPSIVHSIRIEWENKTPGADAGELILQQVYLDFIDDREAPQGANIEH